MPQPEAGAQLGNRAKRREGQLLALQANTAQIPIPPILRKTDEMSDLTGEKTKVLGRIRRMRGQMEAIERAINEEKDCGEILHLVSSVRCAMAGLTHELIDEHLQHHVLGVDDEDERRRGVEDFSSVLRSCLK